MKKRKTNNKKYSNIITVLITIFIVIGGLFVMSTAQTTMDYENNQMTYQTGDTQELPTPVKDGYEFAGWWTKDGSSSGDWGTQVTSISATDMQDMDLYAKWKKQAVLLPIGGKVFLDNGDNGATYTFYDADKNEITYSNLDSLNNAVYYTVDGSGSKDRFYVVASDSSKSDYNSTYGVNRGDYSLWGYCYITTGATTDSIGSGKTNTAQILAIEDTSGYYEDSIWKWLNDVNSNEYGGCSDWFIGSNAECDALNSSGKVGSLFSSEELWSSVESDSDRAWYCYWYYGICWYDHFKDDSNGAVAFRAF